MIVRRERPLTARALALHLHTTGETAHGKHPNKRAEDASWQAAGAMPRTTRIVATRRIIERCRDAHRSPGPSVSCVARITL